jgi:hypothetical protein
MASFKIFIKGDSKKCWSIHKKIFNFLEKDMVFGEVSANDEVMMKDGMFLDIDIQPDWHEFQYISKIKEVTIL